MSMHPRASSSLSAARSGRVGFSLIELIGVVAVLAILAALILPSIIRRVDNAARIKEGNDLLAISNSIALNVMRTRVIPTNAAGVNDWARFVAAWTRTASNQVAVNPRRNPRAYVLDTNGWFNQLAIATNGSPNQPINARALLLSSMDPARPLPNLSLRLATAEFNAIWNTAENVRPATATWTNWGGRGEDLVIQRIDYEPLFHRVIVVNRDPLGTNNLAWFEFESNRSRVTTNYLSRWYLNGTPITLYSGAATNLDYRLTLVDDQSFLFQANRWAGANPSDYYYNEAVANEFATVAANFLRSDLATGAFKANQQGAVVAMFNFMLVYQLWANKCPHFPTYGQQKNDIPEYLLMRDVAGGDGQAGYLNDFTGTGGLLKKP